ncbi:MAG: response regulator [Sulfurimonadaceae bacterium]|jgi:DNA-binding response OmpR family regulator|nr:response regulator [Sulfurimonadaceae bacterium]
MAKSKILIVEDDEVTAMNLKLSLEKHGYEIVSIADTLIQARNKIKIYAPHIILIDISLQESNDGIELASYIRKKHRLPFIFLTAHTDNEIIQQAKLTQPYGYIVKPFDPDGLNATIQMALYKYEQEKKQEEKPARIQNDKLNLEELLYNKKEADRPIVPFGHGYHLDISACETFYEGKKIKLTKKENAFIRLLVAQLGLVVTFKQAMEYVWEENGASENSVRTLVWRLRSKLPTQIINNASGVGYYIEE